jgi:hypothetical protein
VAFSRHQSLLSRRGACGVGGNVIERREWAGCFFGLVRLKVCLCLCWGVCVKGHGIECDNRWNQQKGEGGAQI